MSDKFKEGINIAFDNSENKEIVAAVLTVAYADGSLDSRALMTEMGLEDQMSLLSHIIAHATYSITSCLACVPTGLKKINKVISH